MKERNKKNLMSFFGNNYIKKIKIRFQFVEKCSLKEINYLILFFFFNENKKSINLIYLRKKKKKEILNVNSWFYFYEKYFKFIFIQEIPEININ